MILTMYNIPKKLAKRLCSRSVFLPTTPSQHAVFSKPLDFDTVKQRTADWEPTLPLDGLKTDSKRKDDGDNGADAAQMITYSAFDPGASHPLLLSSALLLSIPAMQRESTTSSLHRAIELQQATPAANGEKIKPWPYALPRVLQPKAGTTYDMVYGNGGGMAEKVEVGVLQKVLYGDPEPRKTEEHEDGKEYEDEDKGLWEKILYGARKEEGEAGC